MFWTKTPVSFGLLGCGGMGRMHADVIARHPLGRLLSVFDADGERAANLARPHPGVTVAEREDAILNDPQIEAVVIATPHNLHKPQTLAALQAGKHVLLEKPMALNHADSREMLTAAAATGRRLLVGQVMRFWPNVERARQAIQNGLIGDVRQVIRRRMNYQKNAGRVWAFDRRNAGRWVVHGNACHEVDAVLYMLGAGVRQVQAAGACNNPDWNDFDELSVVMTLDDGAICTLTQSLNCQTTGIDTVIIGTRGTITLSDLGRGFAAVGETEAGVAISDQTTFGTTDGLGEQLDDFVRAVRDGRASRIDAANVIETMRVLDLIDEQLDESETRTHSTQEKPEYAYA